MELKIHYHAHKPPPLKRILIELNSTHGHFHKIHLNIILPLTPRSPNLSLYFRLPTEIL